MVERCSAPFAEGTKVDYFCLIHECWRPATIVFVDKETGLVRLDASSLFELAKDEQHERLRPRTQPGAKHSQWIAAVLRDGRIEEVAWELFVRHAEPEPHNAVSEDCDDKESQTSQGVVRRKALPALGRDMDNLLGVSACTYTLRSHLQEHDKGEYTLDVFTTLFWEMLWTVRQEYCQALSRERCSEKRFGDPHSTYRFARHLGKGTYGSVQLAYHRETRAKRAIKMIQRGHVRQAAIDPEIDHLRVLDHPNIVKLYEHYVNSDHVYIVMDYCSGGDLRNATERQQRTGMKFPEDFIKHTLRQIVMAIAHVHSRGIIHLDLKLANIALMPMESTLPPASASCGETLPSFPLRRPHVMIIDLGVAQIFRSVQHRRHEPLGTPQTMAPEVWNGCLTPKADVFSIGVVFFQLLTFEAPFKCPVDTEDAKSYWKNRPRSPLDKIDNRSKYAQGLCRRMLLLDMHRRPAAQQAARAHFLVQQSAQAAQRDHENLLAGQESEEAVSLPLDLGQRLVKAGGRSLLHRSVALILAREWPANHLRTVQRAFFDLDADRSGRLEKRRIAAALQVSSVSAEQALDAADSMDLDRDGTIDWTEFVAACIDLASSNLEKDLHRIFEKADADADGLLSIQDMKTLLAVDKMHESEVRDIFVELVGRDDEGARIDWHAFRHHFQMCNVTACPPICGESAPRARCAPPSSLAVLQPPAKPQVERANAIVLPRLLDRGGPHDSKLDQLANKARDVVDWCCVSLMEGAPLVGGVAAPTEEEHLRQLADMGFTDQDRCSEVLRRHYNRLTSAVLDELCMGPSTSGSEAGNGIAVYDPSL